MEKIILLGLSFSLNAHSVTKSIIKSYDMYSGSDVTEYANNPSSWLNVWASQACGKQEVISVSNLNIFIQGDFKRQNQNNKPYLEAQTYPKITFRAEVECK